MLTIADAIEALTNIRPSATTVITEAVIDSRQVIPGSMFVAIPGEKVDGHDYLAESFRRGASFALIQRDVAPSFRTVDLRSGLSIESFTRERIERRVSATYHKTTLLRCLLRDVMDNGVKVFSGKTVIDAQSRQEGARVITSDGTIFEGRYIVAADGRISRIAKALGMNRERTFYGTVVSCGAYMADLDLPSDDIFYTVFMAEKTPMRFYIIPKAADKNMYAISTSTMDPFTDYQGALKRFMTEGNYASWFRRARWIEDRACVGNMISPFTNPVRGNFVFAGDTIWFQEAEMTGAAISGWKAAGAITMALKEDKEALRNYVKWWQDSYAKKYDFTQMVRGAAMNAFLNTEDIDFLFNHIEEALPSYLDPYGVSGLVGGAIATPPS